MWLRVIIMIFSCLLSHSIFAAMQPNELINGVEIYYSKVKWVTNKNFKFTLTPENTVLPNDERITASGYYVRDAPLVNYRRIIWDENSSSFNDGGFEIFIPVSLFPLAELKSGYIIIRMPPSDCASTHSKKVFQQCKEEVKRKQLLYFQIKEMVKNKHSEIPIVLENYNGDRNVWFRCGASPFYKYDNYIGQYLDSL